MEFVIIEAKTFERMMLKLAFFTEKIKSLCEIYEDKGEKKWLTTLEVCQLLDISVRTLQAYRDNGTLPYTQIGHKVYFKPTDIKAFINDKMYNHGK